jgi:hypothetical protein
MPARPGLAPRRAPWIGRLRRTAEVRDRPNSLLMCATVPTRPHGSYYGSVMAKRATRKSRQPEGPPSGGASRGSSTPRWARCTRFGPLSPSASWRKKRAGGDEMDPLSASAGSNGRSRNARLERSALLGALAREIEHLDDARRQLGRDDERIALEEVVVQVRVVSVALVFL